MSAVALPRSIVAPPVISGDDRIKSTQVKLNPANASGATEFSPINNSRIVFNVPSYSKSFLNPKRSYLSFTIKTSANTAKVVDGAPWIDRMTLKGGSVMLEDIQDYSTLERSLSLFEGVDFKQTRGWLEADYADSIRQMSNATAVSMLTEVRAQQFAGRHYTKPLLSGVIGKEQNVYVPISMLNSGGSHALQLELYLADDNQVLIGEGAGTPTYTISDVALHLEVVELPERALGAFNQAVMSGGQLSMPYKSYRSYRQYVPSAQTHVNFNVVDSSKNAEMLLLAMRKQASLNGYTNVTDWTSTEDVDDDALTLVGGTETDSVVSKYQIRYGNLNFPQQPVENTSDSTPTILQALSSMDMLDKSPRLTSMDVNYKPVFENTGFVIAQGFKTSEDAIENGLATNVSGAPIELMLDFSAQTQNVALFAFVKASHSLQVTQSGAVSLVSGRVA